MTSKRICLTRTSNNGGQLQWFCSGIWDRKGYLRHVHKILWRLYRPSRYAYLARQLLFIFFPMRFRRTNATQTLFSQAISDFVNIPYVVRNSIANEYIMRFRSKLTQVPKRFFAHRVFFAVLGSRFALASWLRLLQFEEVNLLCDDATLSVEFFTSFLRHFGIVGRFSRYNIFGRLAFANFANGIRCMRSSTRPSQNSRRKNWWRCFNGCFRIFRVGRNSSLVTQVVEKHLRVIHWEKKRSCSNWPTTALNIC